MADDAPAAAQPQASGGSGAPDFSLALRGLVSLRGLDALCDMHAVRSSLVGVGCSDSEASDVARIVLVPGFEEAVERGSSIRRVDVDRIMRNAMRLTALPNVVIAEFVLSVLRVCEGDANAMRAQWMRDVPPVESIFSLAPQVPDKEVPERVVRGYLNDEGELRGYLNDEGENAPARLGDAYFDMGNWETAFLLYNVPGALGLTPYRRRNMIKILNQQGFNRVTLILAVIMLCVLLATALVTPILTSNVTAGVAVAVLALVGVAGFCGSMRRFFQKPHDDYAVIPVALFGLWALCCAVHVLV